MIVATACTDSVAALKSLGDPTGNVVMDISNPLSADHMTRSLINCLKPQQ
jgi:8-hydroxy-5-deazaflavin:NADPH oxidoreductase